jgi:Uma2 family endonuclease
MNRLPGQPIRRTGEPEPSWEVAYLFPPQGQWTEEEYLALNTNRLVELSAGRLEVPPMPTTSHQRLVGHLILLLDEFVSARDLGIALFAPVPIRLGKRRFREPDIVFALKESFDRIGNCFWRGADLVMEVVIGEEEDRRRDLEIKPREYARAGIPEYWIVDPREGKITVLRLAGKQYAVHGEFTKGAVATSHFLPGFSVEVSAALAQHTAKLPPAPQKPKRSRRS